MILRSSEGDIAIVAHTDVISSYLYLLDSKQHARQYFRLPCGSYYHLNADDNDHVALSDSTYLLPHLTCMTNYAGCFAMQCLFLIMYRRTVMQ